MSSSSGSLLGSRTGGSSSGGGGGGGGSSSREADASSKRHKGEEDPEGKLLKVKSSDIAYIVLLHSLSLFDIVIYFTRS